MPTYSRDDELISDILTREIILPQNLIKAPKISNDTIYLHGSLIIAICNDLMIVIILCVLNIDRGVMLISSRSRFLNFGVKRGLSDSFC